jgi:hypothetical protein
VQDFSPWAKEDTRVGGAFRDRWRESAAAPRGAGRDYNAAKGHRGGPAMACSAPLSAEDERTVLAAHAALCRASFEGRTAPPRDQFMPRGAALKGTFRRASVSQRPPWLDRGPSPPGWRECYGVASLVAALRRDKPQRPWSPRGVVRALKRHGALADEAEAAARRPHAHAAPDAANLQVAAPAPRRARKWSCPAPAPRRARKRSCPVVYQVRMRPRPAAHARAGARRCPRQ